MLTFLLLHLDFFSSTIFHPQWLWTQDNKIYREGRNIIMNYSWSIKIFNRKLQHQWFNPIPIWDNRCGIIFNVSSCEMIQGWGESLLWDVQIKKNFVRTKKFDPPPHFFDTSAGDSRFKKILFVQNFSEIMYLFTSRTLCINFY